MKTIEVISLYCYVNAILMINTSKAFSVFFFNLNILLEVNEYY